ncbi:MAG: hypothetical protein GY898_04855 [Proteobacteria bacterium]|nr:hypothetical protein [Pseudomonadota bacterium]
MTALNLLHFLDDASPQDRAAYRAVLMPHAHEIGAQAVASLFTCFPTARHGTDDHSVRSIAPVNDTHAVPAGVTMTIRAQEQLESFISKHGVGLAAEVYADLARYAADPNRWSTHATSTIGVPVGDEFAPNRRLYARWHRGITGIVVTRLKPRFYRL